jgi:hypothetical protein
MSEAIQLCDLPDDILRATYPMGLIVSVRSSRTIAEVLRDHLAHRLDNLYVVTQAEIHCKHPFYMDPLTQPLPHELEA